MPSIARALRAGAHIAVVALLAACTKTAPAPAAGEDAFDEHLGPRDSAVTGTAHPLAELQKTQRSSPRPELAGQHPRVFIDAAGVASLREKIKSSHGPLWESIRSDLRVFNSEPPAAPAQGRRVQNVVGLGIAEAALAYTITEEEKYLTAAKKWMDAAVSYDVWGYLYNKPNVDLAAGHLLFGLGWGYDLLFHALTEAERARYRDKLVRQARLMYAHYQLKPGRSFAYSQNHVYIPNAGLAVAAYALYGEVPEAAEWAKLSRGILERSLDTYSADGYFYESFEYFVFAVPWLVIWTTAHEHFTGEVLYDRPGFRKMHLYMAHIVLPDRKHVFDFGDAYFGTLTRREETEDFSRTHPGGKLHSNYNLLHATAGWFEDSQAQGVAEFFANQGQVTWYEFMSLLWYAPEVAAEPIESLPAFHHFEDHGVVFYRTDWTANATAIAVKCGPPEGYATVERIKRFPDWHLSSGHAHPDANSFIVFADGKYLTGDSGYSGVPRTDQHNTLLVNGQGQRFTPEGHNAFKGADYAALARATLTVKSLDADGFELVGDATAAYPADVGLTRFIREFAYRRGGALTITDTLEAAEPAEFTVLVHSDAEIQARERELQSGALAVTVTSETPLSIAVEPNWMTGPGRPGSVQKGEREARGHRARVSTQSKTRTAKIGSTLRFP
ncbi:MAG: DUF4962 domain-containing protein [Myxococcota bacterium]